jgi:ferredoxin
MRVVVNFDLCDSNGLCAQAAPEVFEVRSDDFMYVLDERPGPQLWSSVEAAAKACPKLAISLEEE